VDELIYLYNKYYIIHVFPSLDVSVLLVYFAKACYYNHSGAHVQKRP